MLKLTEAELAEMGFEDRDRVWERLLDATDIPVTLQYMQYWTPVGFRVWNEFSSMECYPQTKEDLLTLIRLFTPPKGQS